MTDDINIDIINKNMMNFNEDDIKFYENIIFKYGPSNHNNLSIKNIEEKENIILPQCIKNFLLEEIKRPISALDFKSLYPSIIQNNNLSTETLIKVKNIDKYKNIKLNYEKYDDNEIYSIDHMGNEMGVFPTILNDLGKKRAKIKSKMKNINEILENRNINLSRDEIKEYKYKYSCYDSDQLALKKIMNTFYGEAGNSISSLYMSEIASTVTYVGRKYLMLVKDFLEKKKYKVYYGDSVTGDTPVILFNINTNNIFVEKIKNIVKEKIKWKFDINTQKYTSNINNLKCWSYNGWTNINYIVKHTTKKKIYKISTKMGIVKVTEDHSLLNEYMTPIKINNCKIGITKLLHSYPNYNTCKNTYNNNNNIYNIDRYAYLWGFAIRYSCQNKYNIYFYHSDAKILNHVRNKIYIVANIKNSELEIKKYESKYKMYSKQRIYCSAKLKQIFTNIKKNEIPNEILNANYNSKVRFLLGFLGNYEHVNIDIKKILQNKKFYFRNIYFASQFCTLLYLTDINFNIDLINNLEYQIIINNDKKNLWTVNSIKEIKYKNPVTVYDLGTKSGCFTAGVGCICVHNTDSLYVSPPDYIFDKIDKLYYSNKINKNKYWNDMINLSIQNILKEQIEVNNYLEKISRYKFLRMEYEETLYPALFIAKKKYFGREHKKVAQLDKIDFFKRGLDSEKRGSSLFVKKMMRYIIFELLDINNKLNLHDIAFNKIRDFYKSKIKFEIKDFGKTFRYKNDVKNIQYNTFASKLKQEKGVYLKNGERYSFVIIKKCPYTYSPSGCKIQLNIADRMELINNDIFIEDIDFDYYVEKLINQIGKFILYKKEFQIYDDIDYQKKESQMIKKAIKYINNEIGSHYTKYDNNEGKMKKYIFKYVKKEFKNIVTNLFSHSIIIQNILTTKISERKDFEFHFLSKIQNKSNNICKKFGHYYVRKLYPSFDSLSKKEKNKLIIFLQRKTYINKYIPKNQLLEFKSKCYFTVNKRKLDDIYRNIFIDLKILYINMHKIINEKSIQIYKKINCQSYLNNNGYLINNDLSIDYLLKNMLHDDIINEIKNINFEKLICTEVKKCKHNLKYEEMINNYFYLYKNNSQIMSFIEYLKNYSSTSIKEPKKNILKNTMNNIKKNMMDDEY